MFSASYLTDKETKGQWEPLGLKCENSLQFFFFSITLRNAGENNSGSVVKCFVSLGLRIRFQTSRTNMRVSELRVIGQVSEDRILVLGFFFSWAEVPPWQGPDGCLSWCLIHIVQMSYFFFPPTYAWLPSSASSLYPVCPFYIEHSALMLEFFLILSLESVLYWLLL